METARRQRVRVDSRRNGGPIPLWLIIRPHAADMDIPYPAYPANLNRQESCVMPS